MGKHFVLIHGAWHGDWCWSGVIKELEDAGHTAEAPLMPGHNPGDDRSHITFDSYVEKIVEVLKTQPKPVILVGHSSAGFLLQVAAPKAPDKIEKLIFHNAFILSDGMAQFDLVPPDVAKAMTSAAKASPDNCVPVMEDFVRGMLMGGEPRDIQDALIARLVPQPLALFATKVNTTDFKQLNIPRTVLFCRDDISLPAGAYIGMAQNLGQHDLLEVEGGHETLFARPEVVAQGLMRAVGQ